MPFTEYECTRHENVFLRTSSYYVINDLPRVMVVCLVADSDTFNGSRVLRSGIAVRSPGDAGSLPASSLHTVQTARIEL